MICRIAFNNSSCVAACARVNNKSIVRICSTTAASCPEAPSPKGLPVVGTLFSLLAAGGAPKLHEYVTMRHRQLGSIFKDRIGTGDMVFVSDPDDMQTIFRHEGRYPRHVYPEAWTIYNQQKGCQRGLFFMEGEEWLNLRRVMSNVMLKDTEFNYLRHPCELVAKYTLNEWYEASKSAGEVKNLSDKLYKWSIEVLMASMMGEKYTSESKKRLDPIVEDLAGVVQSVFETTSQISLMPVKFAWKFKLPAWRRFESAMDVALTKSKRLSEEISNECNGKGGGLLQRFLQQGVAASDIMKINADLLLAAGDTTAYTIHWILYLLAKHPDMQQKLFSELKKRESFEIPWLFKGFVRETLRLYPVAPFLTRFIPEDAVIGGYCFRKGTLFVMPLYTSGRDEKYFQQPNKFWPERWTRSNEGRSLQAAVSNASIPFAMGARSCIGKKIAEMQLYLLLMTLVQEYRVKLLNTGDIDIKLRLVAVPSEEIKISLEKRAQNE